jgi:ribosomal protein L11 methyltransferase
MAAANARGARSFVRAVFRTPAAIADEAAGWLVARGALGCAVRESQLTGARRKVVSLEAYFNRLDARELSAMRRAMRSAGMLAASSNGGPPERIVDPGWSTLWMTRFKPLRVGRRFLIVPPWSAARDPRRLTIVIRPGRAFGTGHHPSTAGVLRAIETLCAAHRFRSALDVGTGSGVLAIAMKLLGVDEVMGIDIDRDALANARENAALNNLKRHLKFVDSPPTAVRRRFDLITANILSATLIELAPTLTRLPARDGRLVLGGILEREADAVLKAFRTALRPIAARPHRGWVTLVLSQ